MITVRSNGAIARSTLYQRVFCTLAVSVLAACATRMDNAPVVDRSSGATGALATAAPLGPPPPGYYRVKPGDTLYRVALEHGQNYRDLASWNNLQNANQIEVDQLLRIVPPGVDATGGGADVSTSPIGGGAIQATPLSAGPAAPAPYAAPATPASPTLAPAPASAAAGPVTFAWPVRGPVLQSFDDAKNKGLNIGGNAGDPIRAAGDGRVVYAGSGLRGYGNLVIIKHDATFLSAYAHNRALTVKEGDAVTRGQKIAEMGNSDADRVMLHFEIRRQGKPVDPMRYLPPQ
jgi:lipoprotein NlpD